MKSKLFLLVLAFMAVLLSCNKRSNQSLDAVSQTEFKEEQSAGNGDPGMYAPDQDNQGPVQLQQDSVGKPPRLITSPNVDWDKKIIKTATVQFEVTDFKSFNEMTLKTVRQYGGYIAQEDNNFSEYKSETTMSIKVPVNKFEDLMNGLGNTEAKLLERKITTEDVTGEVIDTKSRLEAKKEMRLKYLEFLKQSRNMKEVLEVQAEINSIQEEIESATARIGHLTHQAAYSTINLTFFQPLSGYKPDNINPSFFTRIVNAFKGGAEWVKNLFVALIYIWPLILLIIFGIFLLRKNKVVKVLPQS
jgi:hypothetical protein